MNTSSFTTTYLHNIRPTATAGALGHATAHLIKVRPVVRDTKPAALTAKQKKARRRAQQQARRR